MTVPSGLSYRALGVLAAIQGGCAADAIRLAQRPGSEGRDAIRTALRDLERARLIERVRVQDKTTGQWNTETRLTASTQVAPGTDSQASGTAKPQVSPKAGIQASVTQASGHTPHGYQPQNGPNPQVAPGTDIQASENQALSTYGGVTRDDHGTLVEQQYAHTHTREPARDDDTRSTGEPIPTTPAPRGTTARPAWDLVRQIIPTAIGSTIRTALALHTAQALADGTPPNLIQTALTDWLNRTGISPNLLPHLIADHVKAQIGQHVPRAGGGLTRGTSGSKRVDKASGFLAPDDPWLTEFGITPAPTLRAIDGGRTA